MNTITYNEIARDYRLWEEYVDPDGLLSEDDFNALTVEEKVQMQVSCFGQEAE